MILRRFTNRTNRRATGQRISPYRSFPWVGEGWRDLRFAVRSLVRTPGFTSIALLVIAIGIGVNSAVFSVVDALLHKPLTYPDPEALVRLVTTSNRGPIPVASMALGAQATIARLSGPHLYQADPNRPIQSQDREGRRSLLQFPIEVFQNRAFISIILESTNADYEKSNPRTRGTLFFNRPSSNPHRRPEDFRRRSLPAADGSSLIVRAAQQRLRSPFGKTPA